MTVVHTNAAGLLMINKQITKIHQPSLKTQNAHLTGHCYARRTCYSMLQDKQQLSQRYKCVTPGALHTYHMI